MSDKTAQSMPLMRRRFSDARPAGIPMTQARRSATAQAVAALVDALPRAAVDTVANDEQEAEALPATLESDRADSEDDDAPAPASAFGHMAVALTAEPAAEASPAPSGGLDDVDDAGLGGDDTEQARAPELRIRIARTKADLKAVIGQRLQAARALAGVQQTQLAQAIGFVNSSQVSQWEAGSRLPPLPQLIAAADHLAVPIDFLVGRTDDADLGRRDVLRNAAIRGTRSMLETIATSVVEAVDRTAALVGPSANDVGVLVAKAQGLVDALATLRRTSPKFDELKASAPVLHAAEELEQTAHRSRQALRRYDKATADLDRKLRGVFAGEPARGGEAA